MKTYQAKLNKGVKGVYGISLVHDPAMEGDFLTFSKQEEVKFATVDEEKRLLLGLVLEPNKLILRRDQEGNPFNVFFGDQDVIDVAHNFQTKAYQNNSTIEHKGDNVSGLTFVETWTVSDPKIDKSAAHGFEYPKNSWVSLMKVDNEEIWKDYVKTGKVKGFSIDAFMHLEEVKESINLTNIEMEDEKNPLQAILDFIKGLMPKEKEEEEVVEEEVVAKEVIASKDEPKDEPKKEVVELAKEEPVKVDLSKEIEKATLELTKSFDEKVEAVKVEMSKDIEAVKKENEELKKEVVELSKQPAEKKINSAPVQLDYSKMTNVEKMKYNQSK